MDLLAICQKLKLLWHFDFLLTLNIWGWKFQNAIPVVLIRSEPNFMMHNSHKRI